MRLRNPKFSTSQEIENMTTEEMVKDMNRKYVVKHIDGWEQGLHWNTTNKSKSTLFSSYSDATEVAVKGSKIYQTY